MKKKNKSQRWVCKDERIAFSLKNCKLCGKRSNTTDRQTSAMSYKYGRICRACKEALPHNCKRR